MRNPNLESEIRMGMNLIERDEFTDIIGTTSHVAANVVKRTLGPYAHTTIIDDGSHTYPTKDGWSVLQRIRFQDPVHQSIYNVLKTISARINDKVGDGTTTAMVVADHFIRILNGHKEMGNYRQKDVTDALIDVTARVTQYLRENAIRIDPSPTELNPTYDEIYDVAMVSSNGNTQLAKIMQTIYQKTRNPNVMVDTNGGITTTYEIQDGYRLDVNFLMSERYANTSEKYYHGDQPHNLVIFDHNVNYNTHAQLIEQIITQSNLHHRPVILMAPHYDDMMSSSIAIMVQNFLAKNPTAIPGLVVIQIPEMSTTVVRNAVLDFAALANVTITNAAKVKLFAELRHNDKAEEGDKIHDPINDMEGYQFTTAQELLTSCITSIDNFTVGKTFFTMHNPDRSTTRYKEILQKATEDYNDALKEVSDAPSAINRKLAEATYRFNKLSGALGVIHVGGASDIERSCTKDVVDDTFLACRSAFENGVVAGLNMGAMVAINTAIQFYEGELEAIKNDPSRAYEAPSVHLREMAGRVLLEAYRECTMDVFRNKNHMDENSDWGIGMVMRPAIISDDDPMAAVLRELPVVEEDWSMVEALQFMVNQTAKHPTLSYDMLQMKATIGDRVPKICNSVATDVEIMNGIVSILSMILTSDQYMSVARAYDKTAAMRHQAAVNKSSLEERVCTILSSIDTFLAENPDNRIGVLLGQLVAPASMPPTYFSENY